MDVNKLQVFILFIVISGMLLGVGIVAFDKFGDSQKIATNVVNEIVAVASATGTLANDEVSSISSVTNETGELVVDVSADDFNFTTGGVMFFNASIDENMNVSYVYDKDTVGTTAMNNLVDAASPIGSTWIPLIITIGALGIVMFLVLRSFGKKR
jgi:hypothetical protein